MKYSSCKSLKNLPFVAESLPNISLPLLSSIIFASFASPAYGVQLDFSDLTGNLSNGDENGIGATMIFNDVASDNETVLDLIITTVDSYEANNLNNNRTVNTNEGEINVKKNTGTTFEFQFVEQDTTTPFTVSQLDFGLMDIDNQGAEKVLLLTSGNYTVSGSPTPTSLDISSLDNRLEFQANSTSVNEVSNPTDATSLNAEQEQHSVNFQFNNISEFYLRYEVSSSAGGGGRNFFFAGDVTLDNTNPVTTNFQPVPFEFSPSLGLLLSGGSMLGIKYLKRRKRLNN